MTRELTGNNLEYTFDSQLGELQRVESWGGQAAYKYFRQEVPREGALPVLVAGGWSEGTMALQDTGRTIYEDGREVILVDHARTGGYIGVELAKKQEIIHKAHSLIQVIDDIGLGKIDVIAHSEGALNVTQAAEWRPDRFRNIILVAPAGMIGKDSRLKLTGRFALKTARFYTRDMIGVKLGTAWRVGTTGPRYTAKNPLKASREVSNIANARIDESLVGLRERGIQVGLIQSNSDLGFPASRIERHVGWNGGKANVDAYASAASRGASHDDLLLHPERSTRAALQMLEMFEKR